jgi:hypothetical protein
VLQAPFHGGRPRYVAPVIDVQAECGLERIYRVHQGLPFILAEGKSFGYIRKLYAGGMVGVPDKSHWILQLRGPSSISGQAVLVTPNLQVATFAGFECAPLFLQPSFEFGAGHFRGYNTCVVNTNFLSDLGKADGWYYRNSSCSSSSFAEPGQSFSKGSLVSASSGVSLRSCRSGAVSSMYSNPVTISPFAWCSCR